jgi:hypothetical protein
VTLLVIRLCYGLLLTQAWVHAHWATAAVLTIVVVRREIEDFRIAMYQRNYLKESAALSAELGRQSGSTASIGPDALARHPELRLAATTRKTAGGVAV